MAYHYMLNADSGESRTIRSETLPRYWNSNGGLIAPWHVFNSEAERDAFMPPELWTYDPYSPRSEPHSVMRDQRGYWTRRGNRVANTEAEARTALEPVWYITGRDVICTSRDIAGSRVTFSSEAEARATLPPTLWVMDRFGYHFGAPLEIAPTARGEYDPALYIIGATRTEVLEGLPFHYRWIRTKWMLWERRQGSTLFRQLRVCLSELKQNHVAEYANTTAGNGSLHVSSVLDTAWSNFLKLHPLAGSEFVERVNAYVAFECLTLCAWCNLRPVRNGFCVELGGQPTCQHCAERRVPCETCGAICQRDDMRENDTGQLFCSEHPPVAMDPPAGKLLGYTVNVLKRKDAFLRAQGERGADLWLGWELEVYPAPGHTVASCVMDVRATFGTHCICKADSTIGGGFEIVSVPATLQWHRQHSVPFLRAMRGRIEGWKHDNAGLHVHVGRKELSPLQIGRMSAFLDHPSNTPFVTKIAGRGQNDYARRALKKLSYGREGIGGQGRYSALNLQTTRGDTAELRIFRSNVAPLGFLKALEFTHALASWARFAGNFEVAPSHVGIRGGEVSFNRAPNPYDEDDDDDDGETPYADYEAETAILYARSSGSDDRGVKAFIAYAQKNRGSYPKLWQWLQEVGYATGLRYEPVAIGE